MASPRVVFTERERQVIERFMDGQTEVDIADAMGIAAEAVRSHLQHVIDKLSLHLRLPTEG